MIEWRRAGSINGMPFVTRKTEQGQSLSRQVARAKHCNDFVNRCDISAAAFVGTLATLYPSTQFIHICHTDIFAPRVRTRCALVSLNIHEYKWVKEVKKMTPEKEESTVWSPCISEAFRPIEDAPIETAASSNRSEHSRPPGPESALLCLWLCN